MHGRQLILLLLMLSHATISANAEVVECNARMIVIANAQKYGTGVVINPKGLMDDGLFELIVKI
jgi:diacylglycerol kinase family enzyme